MSTSKSESVLESVQIREFTGRPWSISEIVRSAISVRAADAGATHFSEISNPLEPNYVAKKGEEFLTWDKESKSMSLVRIRVEHSLQVHRFTQGQSILLINRARTAFMVSESVQDSFFDGELLAFDLQDRKMALWVWGLLNSESENKWNSALQSVASRTTLAQKSPDDFFVHKVENEDSEFFAELDSLVHMVNQEIPYFEDQKSVYKTADLPKKSRWFLNDLPILQPESRFMSLGSLVENVFTGNSSKTSSAGGLPTTGGGWILGVKDSHKRALVEESSVLAQPGDVVYSYIGPKGQARLVSESMVVANGHYLLKPKSETQAESIANFLNSRFANQQRRHFVPTGNFGALRQQDLLGFQFIMVSDFRQECREIMKKAGLK